jgi:hypothetical protein
MLSALWNALAGWFDVLGEGWKGLDAESDSGHSIDPNG